MHSLLNGVSLNLGSLEVILDAFPFLLKVPDLTPPLSYALQQEPLLVIESCDLFLRRIDRIPLGL